MNEMHWKSINFLIKNYDCILLPTFAISKMIKGKRLGKITKRVMTMFRFYQFKLKLTYMCERYKKQLIIVDESYTSKTCGCCGHLNTELGSSELFECPKCKIEMDRDVQGARNIFLKNVNIQDATKEATLA